MRIVSWLKSKGEEKVGTYQFWKRLKPRHYWLLNKGGELSNNLRIVQKLRNVVKK